MCSPQPTSSAKKIHFRGQLLCTIERNMGMDFLDQDSCSMFLMVCDLIKSLNLTVPQAPPADDKKWPFHGTVWWH